MTPIKRGLIAIAFVALLGAIYWFFGPVAEDDIAMAPEAPVETAPAVAREEAAAAPAQETAAPEPEQPAATPVETASASEPAEAAPETTVVEPEITAVEPEPTVEEETAAAAPEPENVEPEATAQAVEPEVTQPARSGDRKSSAEFDIVRVEPGGTTLIAGRSAPGAEIKLMMDGKEAGSAIADNTGNFVMFSELGASDTPRVLTLSETWLDGTKLEAEESVILGPIAAAQPQEVASVAEPVEVQPSVTASEPVIAPPPAVQSQAPASTGSIQPAPEVAVAAPVAPTVLVADETGVRVLQSAGDVPQALTNVSIDTISYDAAGEVALAGRSTGASVVRVYLNNSLLIEADIGQNGQWRTQLPDVDTGTYTLRVDEVNASGDVVSRAETPFRRESVEAIRSIEQETELSLAPVSLITVQPGNTLWEIAREKYGEGPLYVRVFDANTDRIRNPDLIYPGQIFTVPD